MLPLLFTSQQEIADNLLSKPFQHTFIGPVCNICTQAQYVRIGEDFSTNFELRLKSKL